MRYQANCFERLRRRRAATIRAAPIAPSVRLRAFVYARLLDEQIGERDASALKERVAFRSESCKSRSLALVSGPRGPALAQGLFEAQGAAGFLPHATLMSTRLRSFSGNSPLNSASCSVNSTA